MRIRTKLLVAMAVPAGLLVAQIASVSFFVRELQSAVSFISSAHAVIEANFNAVELIGALRAEVKQLPSNWVAEQDDPNPLQPQWVDLTWLINVIVQSSAAQAIEPAVLEAVTSAFGNAANEYQRTQAVTTGGSTDLNTLIERAIFLDKALASLGEALS